MYVLGGGGKGGGGGCPIPTLKVCGCMHYV